MLKLFKNLDQMAPEHVSHVIHVMRLALTKQTQTIGTVYIVMFYMGFKDG